MNMKNSFIFFTIIMLFINCVYAQEIIGVSPGEVKFSNVLRGGYAERPILISLTSEKNVKMSIEPRGEIADWLNFSEFEKYVSKESSWRLKIKVSPPSDIPNGNYTGFLRVSSESISDELKEGHATGAVQTVIDVAMIVEVIDREFISCKASSFEVNSVEKGDEIPFFVTVENRGNIRIRPKLLVDIWDKDQLSVVKSEEFLGEEILPTTSERINFRVESNDMEISQYWVDFSSIDCSDSETLTFDVLEPGTLRADGVLTGIVSKIWADIDETIPIIVNFKNIGEKEVEAQFKGKINYQDSIFNILESEKISVPILDSNNFTFYFTPRKSGKYVISGRVYYDKKKTFEASTIVNVKPKNFGLKNLIIYVIYALILTIVIYLFYKVRSEKLKYLEKLRRLKSI